MPRHRRDAQAAARATRCDPVATSAHCVARLWTRPAGPDLARDDDAVLGRRRDLQFIVIEWARAALGFDLSQAAILQGVVAVGIALGAVLASRLGALDRAVRVIPLGIAMGVVVIVMNFVDQSGSRWCCMILIGALAGFFVVPMNALLQHRGHHLMGAGRSIAVQNFNENTSILVMIALYSLLLNVGHSIYFVIIAFGLFVAGDHGAGAALVPRTTAARTATKSSACSPSRAPRTRQVPAESSGV